jgi:hypothetical protein
MTNPDPHDRLAARIDRLLREVPLRTAPAALEHRVLDAIERHAARPWWKQDFLHWPVAARLVFLGAAAAVARLLLIAPARIRGSLSIDLPPEISWIEASLQAVLLTIQHLPALVLYGGLIVLALLYATLFGVGALAYRSLLARPS